MNELINLAARELESFLGRNLSSISPEWWQKLVLDRLSFQQQRYASEKNIKTLKQLDFAALIRVLDQNWNDLSNHVMLPREGRSWVKELQVVRNKWAHVSGDSIPIEDIYRDADTLDRLMRAIGAAHSLLETIAETKAKSVSAMTVNLCSPCNAQTDDDELQENKHTVIADNSSNRDVVPMFTIGDIVAVRSNPNILMPVIKIIPGGAECRYNVFHNNGIATYYQSQLQKGEQPSDNLDQISAAELRSKLTSVNILSPSNANLFSLRSGRIHFVPYQYRPVIKLIRADRPRLLIADEVGVGKTIEAGLVIKELRARMDLSSILVICPKPLVAERKWFLEMKRFDEQFIALDGPALRHCMKETHLDGEWPRKYDKTIIPFSLFDSDFIYGNEKGRIRQPGLIDLESPPKFDLVILDEAHHIRNPSTYLHQGVRLLCENAQAVVFLTATPVQLASDDLFVLLNVLRPDLIIDRASFEQMAEPNISINKSVLKCRSAEPEWARKALEHLSSAARTDWGKAFLRESPKFQKVYDRLQENGLSDDDRIEIIHSIEDLYTFSPIINRTRRRDIGDFTTRRPETVTIDFTPSQRVLHDSLMDIISEILELSHGSRCVKFMMTTIRRQAASSLHGLAPLLGDILRGKLDQIEYMEAGDDEIDIDQGALSEIKYGVENLLLAAKSLDPYDPKLERLKRILAEKSLLPNNKSILFSTFRHTLAHISKGLNETSLRVGLVHGDIPEEERSDIRRCFALPKEDTDAIDVLLSSEVGCEGLDFQFCDFLVNYDIPWNPMRIEQRIGRIDRYGQKNETVAIVNMITPGTVDADIYERCLWRIGVFQHTIGASEEILGDITREIHDIAENFRLSPEEKKERLQQLSDNNIRRIREERELESKQSELFGLNIPKQSWQKDIEDAESFWLSPSAIQSCVNSYLSAKLGICIETHPPDKKIANLRLAQEGRDSLMRDYKGLGGLKDDSASRAWEKWLKGNQPNLSVTFDQESATENPNLVHLSLLHPLVRQAAKFLEIKKAVFTSLSLHSSSLPEGLHTFAIYRWCKHGLKQDHTILPIALSPEIESSLLDLVKEADDACDTAQDVSRFKNELDIRHHRKWTEALANHINDNSQLVEHRRHSLSISHNARVKLLCDQIGNSTNDKIRLMKESELARANAEYKLQMDELEKTAGKSDIFAEPLVFGTILIRREA